MGEDRAVWQHRFFTRMTAIKLAAQTLERDRGLSDRQRRLVRTVIRAADELVADLLDRRRGPEGAFGVRGRATADSGLSPDQSQADKQGGTGRCGEGEQDEDEHWKGRNLAPQL